MQRCGSFPKFHQKPKRHYIHNNRGKRKETSKAQSNNKSAETSSKVVISTSQIVAQTLELPLGIL